LLNQKPARPKAPGSMVPLTGLQLLCVAAVAGLGVYTTASLFDHEKSATQAAVGAFELAAEVASAQSAAEAALAGLSEITVVVKPAETLEAIFRRLEFSLSDLASIRSLEGVRAQLDRLRVGDELTLATRDGQLVALLRPLSVTQMLHAQRDEEAGFVASVEELPVDRQQRTASGVIDGKTSSLFLAGAGAGVSDATIMEMAEIFRYDVDFALDLRLGDSFKVIYEQLSRDGKVLKDGGILAAEFVNDGQTYRAVRYQRPDGTSDYYTPEGVSLRKAFLKTPVQFSRISSVFNPNRKHPVLNTIRAHKGVDYAAPTGTKVVAAGAGRVQFRGVKGGYGNVVEIVHAGKVVTRYGHLSKFASGLANGQKVEQGQLIGYVGSTGLATGPHLHFEFIKNGQHVDPQKEIRRGEPGPPVPAAEREQFASQIAPLLARLEGMPVQAPAAYAAR
jgi:murein DD-endopeptidase MepM/ murein hydrolase activator NlpD